MVSLNLVQQSAYFVLPDPVELAVLEKPVENSFNVETKGCKILLVDDDESNAFLSQIILERLRYFVQTCRDGQEALKVFRSAPDSYHFVATDYSMNSMDGLELARQLLEINPQVPILLLTGFDHPAILHKAKEIGIRKVSLKPSTEAEFKDIIQDSGL
jgi:CheY-like chemotaxis protein